MPNGQDLCSNTPAGKPVWQSGPWIGCAGGQLKDSADSDNDGIPDTQDLCSGTPAGKTVWTSGPWIGCAGGQYPDKVWI